MKPQVKLKEETKKYKDRGKNETENKCIIEKNQ